MNFKFQMGDHVVTHVGVIEAETFARGGVFQIPSVGQITGRVSDECPGGTQLFYVVGYGSRANKVHEAELILHKEWCKEGLTRLLEVNKQARAEEAWPAPPEKKTEAT